ncbi:hypothetical protein [Clostridium sp. BJN0001]|uniref:hypothetical protein n=1 Tax=Clostridium sp. BJN0001 TaxID=2930219 RepID=UPI001FD2D65E|nr:hypothetical protein [Clostridium sp. BJN0001]
MIEEKYEVMESVYKYINNLKKGLKDVSNMIQSGNEIQGIKKFIPSLDGIEYIIKVAELTKDIQKDHIDINKLNDLLKEIIDSFENEDYVLLGDLINYELIPIINDIQISFRRSLDNR